MPWGKIAVVALAGLVVLGLGFAVGRTSEDPTRVDAIDLDAATREEDAFDGAVRDGDGDDDDREGSGDDGGTASATVAGHATDDRRDGTMEGDTRRDGFGSGDGTNDRRDGTREGDTNRGRGTGTAGDSVVAATDGFTPVSPSYDGGGGNSGGDDSVAGSNSGGGDS